MRIGIAVVLSAMSLHVHAANAPCDASVPIKGCRAEIKLEGNWIVLTSNTPKCSVIEWTLDGSFRQTTVLDGEERIELLTTKPKELTVESCTQVRDLRALKDDSSTAANKSQPTDPIGKCGCRTNNKEDHDALDAYCKSVCDEHYKSLLMQRFCRNNPDSSLCK